jgi:ribosomal-protein-alanine N-acetyltransferase
MSVAVVERLSVEPMTLEDIPAVHEIERLSFATPWPAYAFRQELTTNGLARYVVARAASRVVGFAGIWLMADEAHITTFGVHPEWRRMGVGRRLLLALIDLSERIGAGRVTLEVRVRNAAAQALYREFGFVVVGRRPRYYTDDGEDALVMTTPALDSAGMRALVAQARARLAVEDGEPDPATDDREAR